MQEVRLRELYWQNVDLMDAVKQLLKVNRQGNTYLQTKWIRRILNKLKQSLEIMVEVYSDLVNAGLSFNVSYLLDIMTDLSEAQEREDWIRMGDLYETSLLPALFQVQSCLQSMSISYEKPEWLQESLDVLKDKNPDIYKALMDYNETSSGSYYRNTIYEVEPSKQGYYTLALTEEDRTWSLCSTYMPMEEARAYAERVYQPDVEKYMIFGWGMGYHIRALLEKNPDADILVYEPDLDILYCAFVYADCKSLLERVKLVWDKEWKQLSELMNYGEWILYRPELVHIPIPSVRQQMITIADRKDSIDSFQDIFYLNTRENIRSCTGYVDSLKPHFKGRRLVIVAAGPSLDKNVEKLRKKPDDVVVMAVGTSYRLLVQKGILPDYVIVSDAYVSHQILGVEAQVPILMLATADRRISRQYAGDTYLICQKGYAKAAEYAKEQGVQTYDSGGSVATLALDVAIRMEAAAIAFIGLDLAYYGNRAHASGTGKEVYGGYEFCQVEGIYGDRLNTSQVFTNYRMWMERRITEQDVTMPVIDATEGGAKKKGFQIMTLEEYYQMKIGGSAWIKY